MTIQEQDTMAARIRRIREASAEARNKAGLMDASEELLSGFDEDIFEETIN